MALSAIKRQGPCIFIALEDKRCFLSRRSSTAIEDVIYYCGKHPEECPIFGRLRGELDEAADQAAALERLPLPLPVLPVPPVLPVAPSPGEASGHAGPDRDREAA